MRDKPRIKEDLKKEFVKMKKRAKEKNQKAKPAKNQVRCFLINSNFNSKLYNLGWPVRSPYPPRREEARPE